MILIRTIIGVVCLASGTLLGQGGTGPSRGGNGVIKQVSLSIANETAPPGGLVQMKFMVTEPTPISSGRPGFYYDDTTFDGVWGIELFCATGDISGVAVIDGSRVNLLYNTSSGVQGTDYPIMTVALHVRPDAVPGTQTQFSLDPSSTWILGLLGPTTLKPMQPAIVSVAGSISISNVVPGGGIFPAGSVVSIRGMGFQPKTQVQLNAINFTSLHLVSPEEIQFTLAEATNMTGQKIQVVNPDGSQDTYYSYLRGTPFGQSNQPLLAHAVPVFSSVTHSIAVFNAAMPADSTQFTGLAIQNPNLTPADVTICLYSPTNMLLGSSTVTLPGGSRMMNEVSELAQGAAPVSGSYIVVKSAQPMQSFGFTGDNFASTVTPLPPA